MERGKFGNISLSGRKHFYLLCGFVCIVCAMFRFSVWQQIFNEFTRCVWSVASVQCDEKGSDEREGKGAEMLLPLPFLFITVPARSALFSFHIQNTFGKY